MVIGENYIFVHVPKTAGSSIVRALPDAPTKTGAHRTLKGLEKGNRKTFGFVRNPWDRMVSLYHFLQQRPPRTANQQYKREIRKLSFNDWLIRDSYMLERYYEKKPYQTVSQMHWLDDVDMVGRFEALELDFRRIVKALRINATALPHIQKSEHGPYQDYYDDKARKFVAKFAAPEIEAFGYRFE